MEDSDINITLNLNTTTAYNQNKTSEKVKVFGNRRERIKQRRQIKKQRNETLNAASQGQSSSDNKRKRPSEEDDEDEEASPPKKFARKDGGSKGPVGGPLKRSEKGVISSLFRHNPDIPTVKSRNVKGVKEEVFASTKFSDLSLHPHLISNLEEKMKLVTMTRVQQMSIPVILGEKDVLIKSQTGSGKTLAYAVPIVHTLASLPRKIQRTHGPYAVVIVPTRELAIQSHDTFQKLLQSAVWVVAGCLMGGEKRKAEKARIRKGINILVSTPGRLLDHLKHTDCLNFDRVGWLVIDEADRLLELGYEKDIAQIISILNTHSNEKQRQTILLSATLTAGVERLSGMALKNHESIDASVDNSDASVEKVAGAIDSSNTQDINFTVPEKLKQHFVIVPCKVRLVTLAAFILWKCKMQTKKSKMVVFLNTQDSVEFHHQLFNQVFNKPLLDQVDLDDSLLEKAKSDDFEELDVFRLHGDMAQKDRTQVFQEFTTASSGVLLCTDVAARGLHLPKVDWIVQYTTPGATVDYIHRVGRTARAGKQGNALLFLMPSEADYIKELNKHKISLTELPMKDILTTLLSAIHDLPFHHTNTKRQLPRTFEEASTFMQDRFEDRIVRNRDMQTLAAKGYQSFVRAYATYPSHLKEFFSVKDLHLGHVAKSFALRESPSHLHGAAKRGQKKDRRSEGHPRLKFDQEGVKKFQRKLPLSSTVSEFGNGFISSKGVATHSKRKSKKKKIAFR